jgi:hypothetical protein
MIMIEYFYVCVGLRQHKWMHDFPAVVHSLLDLMYAYHTNKDL